MRLTLCSLVLLAATMAQAVPSSTREMSLEDTREAIFSLVHMIRDSGDKLERHEYRERQLGEQLKKALGGLDKRQRSSDQATERLGTIVKSVEERLKNVETMITQRDERERIQLQKTQNIVEGIQESLTTWMKTMEDMISSKIGNTADKPSADSDAGLSKCVDNIARALERVESAVASTNEVEVDNLRSATSKLSSTDAKVRHSVAETERILSQYEARLGELKGSTSVSEPQPSEEVQDWHPVFLTALESHQKILQDLRQTAHDTAKHLGDLPRRKELSQLTNTTHDLLQEVKYHIESNAEKNAAKLTEKLAESQTTLGRGQEETMKIVTDASVMTETLYADVTKSYDQLLKEVVGLAKVEQVMIQTADNVMDTKRRIEYGVHQILLEVGDLVKLQSKELNATINRRFDNISSTILDNQTGALTNLSTKIENEISQVWRQIGIMYQQLTASAAVLDHLQQQTEIYVNGSLRTMDSMEGKVGQITGRMGEVDENLNYLLGRLSLVTQEFNMIKSGLSTALDNIRSSFLSVQDKIKDVGPGPNPIPDGDIAPPIGNNIENEVDNLNVEPK